MFYSDKKYIDLTPFFLGGLFRLDDDGSQIFPMEKMVGVITISIQKAIIFPFVKIEE